MKHENNLETLLNHRKKIPLFIEEMANEKLSNKIM
jgi:hypothetical protein